MRLRRREALLVWFVGAGSSWACGRENVEWPGALGAPCYPNQTCDGDLVCSGQSTCVDPDPCAGVSCSGHGTCRVVNGRTSCICETGYVASGLRCLVCADPGCDQGCPADMVPITGQPSCIDRYEATIFDRPDCTGLRYGSAGDDFPAGFPRLVESAGCEGSCRTVPTEPATVELYACSVAGVRPTTFVTWYRAKRACENSGKVLCRMAEWTTACGGPAGLAYPYGNDFVAGACNDSTVGAPSAVITGSFPGCEGGEPGLYDMSANLFEWTEDGGTGEDPPFSGGSFGRPSAESCGYWELGCGECGSADVGFRCCRPR
jgi:hypothetical protein